jgi:hypothetical protein
MSGFLLVTELGQNQVQIFDQNKNFVTEFGKEGAESEEISLPR